MKATTSTVGTLLFLLGTVSLAQVPVAPKAVTEEFDRVCEKVLCRDPTTVRVSREGGSILEVPINVRMPYLQPNGWVTIFPGEEILVEVDVDGERITNPRVVRKPHNASKTLTFKFWQEPNRKDSYLSVANPFRRMVKFNLGMMLVTDERLLKTTSCPAPPELTLYEHWPHPIFQLVVANIRLLPEGAEPKCEN